jgi:hypothetical protein
MICSSITWYQESKWMDLIRNDSEFQEKILQFLETINKNERAKLLSQICESNRESQICQTSETKK